MFPIFKSHFSIGKSILTLDPPEDQKKDGADSVFGLAQELDLKEVVMVEDTFMGFLQGQKVANSLGMKFIFGLRIPIVDEFFDESSKKIPKHKVVVFARNAMGCKQLFKIYSEVKSEELDAITLSKLCDLWQEDNLQLAIPFYDSFIFSNLFLFNSFVVDLSCFKPTFLVEDNDLPFDYPLKNYVTNYCNSFSYPIESCKSIFYKNRSDFDAFVTYKLICSRNTFASSKSSLEKPNFDHMGSREFCYESYTEL